MFHVFAHYMLTDIKEGGGNCKKYRIDLQSMQFYCYICTKITRNHYSNQE